MKLNVGDYIRIRPHRENNSQIGIFKINKIEESNNSLFIRINYAPYWKCQIVKSSPNIIDLIEVGDYVNGGQVREKTKNYIRISGGELLWQYLEKKEDIKSIVTKEQMEQMQYKVEELICV